MFGIIGVLLGFFSGLGVGVGLLSDAEEKLFFKFFIFYKVSFDYYNYLPN